MTAPSGNQEAEPPGNHSAQYSRAFENIVRDSDDVIGLLAYALFKEAVREEVRQGALLDNTSRNPPPATVTAFRMAAEQRLAEIINNGIEAVRPEISKSATVEAIAAARSDVIATIESRTGFASALIPNIAAWAITIVLTAILIFVLDKPEPSRVLAKSVEQVDIPASDPLIENLGSVSTNATER